MKENNKFYLGILVGIVFLGAVLSGAVLDRVKNFSFLDKYLPRTSGGLTDVTTKVLNEENVVVDVTERVSPSVVTISIKKTQVLRNLFNSDSFNDPFYLYRQGPDSGATEKKIEQDIGTGFVLTSDGFVVTNKHVVSDPDAKYQVIMKDDKTYEVEKIYRDPGNDLAILKINASGLVPVEMGDSSKLKVGQFVIAIGTALGEFRHTVTTGVVSGLGRGIIAGGIFEGSERLDGVIQTDAAINPGNSGGPLLNSVGQVIGVNSAISTQGQNIGFALPINIVKDAVENFNKTGQFNRPYLGVSYRMINQRVALLNEVPQGAYIQDLIEDSPAQKAGLEVNDIVIKMAGNKIDGDDEAGLAKEIGRHKVGDVVEVEVWRDGETKTFKVKLEESGN